MERVGPAKHCRTDGDELSSWTSQLDSLSFTGSQRAEVVYTNTHILPLYYTDYTILALSTVNYKELGEPAYERIGNNRPKVVKVVTGNRKFAFDKHYDKAAMVVKALR